MNPGRRGPKPGAIPLLLTLLLAGCAAPSNPATGDSRPVWLVASGWHTGIALRRADIPADLWPEAGDFATRYLEVGWGDRDYYQARQSSIWLALKAALVPGPGVLHVAGFDPAPPLYFGVAGTRRIPIVETGFRNLLVFIHESFSRHGQSRAQSLGPGLYGDSRFYPATGRFHLFENCNVWTARALRAAGLPLSPGLAVTATGLRAQLPPGIGSESAGRELVTEPARVP